MTEPRAPASRLGVRAFVYPAVAVGVFTGAASQLWPERSLVITLWAHALLLPWAAWLVLRWRANPEALRQFREEAARLQQPPRLSRAARLLFAALALVSAAATAYCAAILMAAPDFWILFLPLTCLGALVTAVFAIIAWSGSDRAATGLLP